MCFFQQFKDHKSGREHENYTNDPIFSSTFSALPVFNIHFWIWKYLKLIFKLLLWSILVCQIPQFFCQKLLLRTAHHTFLESRHPELTKNLYYVLCTRQSQIPIFLVLAHGLYWRLKKISYRANLLFYYFFDEKNSFLKGILTCTFIHLLLNSFTVQRLLCCWFV